MHVADIFGMDKMISAAMFNDTSKMVVAWAEIGWIPNVKKWEWLRNDWENQLSNNK